MKEYLLGNIVGITQTLIGHPFDTIKINLQNTSNTKSNIKSNINSFYKKPLNLYRGISYPLIMNSITTSFLFGNYNYFYKYTNNNIISGILTGCISATITNPFDYKKIILQTSNNNIAIKTNIIQQYYSGYTYTLGREIISIPIYFSTYQYIMDHNNNPFLAGGIAGINSWLFSYPLDTLKTRKQIYQNKTFLELLKMKNIFNGLSITLLRAFIVNSTSFYLYALCK